MEKNSRKIVLSVRTPTVKYDSDFKRPIEKHQKSIISRSFISPSECIFNFFRKKNASIERKSFKFEGLNLNHCNNNSNLRIKNKISKNFRNHEKMKIHNISSPKALVIGLKLQNLHHCAPKQISRSGSADKINKRNKRYSAERFFIQNKCQKANLVSNSLLSNDKPNKFDKFRSLRKH